jgi:pimeloyl-ACP methyl ester carboxylesterase
MTQFKALNGAKRVKANGIEIVYDTCGDSGAPPLLLIMGLGGQLVAWDETLCRQLAAAGHWVIRFDNRDVGLSSHFDQAGTPNLVEMMSRMAQGKSLEAPYLLTDMAADAVGLLDALHVPKAHILGVSMGGMIAQTMAIHYPARVRTLTSVMSLADPAQPLPTPEALKTLFNRPPATRKAYLDYQIEVWRVLGSPGFPLDEDVVRRRAALAYDRGLNPPGFARQLAAIWASGSRKAALKQVKIPLLVIHGKADPLVPVAGGMETAECIPGSKLVLIEGMGHELPVEIWPQLVNAVTEHTHSHPLT